MRDQQDLYGLPLEQFVAARGELAKALRRDGRREQAAEVSSLRKPSVAAWAVNQLVRTQGKQLAALFDAGDALTQAQSELLGGRGEAGALRGALERERTAVDELAAKARGLLSAEGHELSSVTLERVSDTLHAAALDGEARAQVRGGCLERELRHVGLGAGEVPAAPGRPRARVADRGRADAPGARRAPRSAAADKKREQALKRAQKAQDAAGREAERAERELKAAQARREDAASRLAQADETLGLARERAEQALREHRRATKELEKIKARR